MIEATCGACGTAVRIAEADVPAGAKFVTCASCKSRVPLPAGKAGAKPPMPPVKPPAIPGKPPMPPVPTTSSKPTVDLADLPAPKRSSALAGVEASKTAPKSSLAGAELPAPKGAKPASGGAIDLDDLMPPAKAGSTGLADLPAPKARTSALGDAPASKPVPSALADLPAPKGKPSPLADLPAPKAKPSALSDLPAPAAKKPTPGAAAAKPAVPPQKPASADLDFELGPASSGGGDFELDLPAPKASGMDDFELGLPAPKANAGGGNDFDLDLPAPKANGGGDFDLDLPAPKAAAKGSLDFDDLPSPKGGSRGMELDLGGELDLPAPKAGLDDLPTPKPGGKDDLPAPKGFFDDLPQPSKKAPAAAGSDLDLPAPKGFFDDLPAPSKASAGGAKGGFFDDLPTPAKSAATKAADAAAAKGGFFDDLPEPVKPGAAGAKPGSAGLFDDLEQPVAAPVGGPDEIQLGAGDLDLGPLGNDKPFELDGKGGDLDLGLSAGNQQFSELDLSEPTSGKKPGAAAPDEPASPIKIKTPAKGAAKTPIAITVKKEEKANLELTLADDPHAGKGGAAPAAATTKAGVKGDAAKAKGKGPAKTPEQIAEEKAKKAKRQKVMLGAVLGVAALGAGGFYFYKKHAAEVARREEIASAVSEARAKLADDKPDHWAKASAAAQHALELAPNDGVALGLAAEAAIAGALDNGKNFDARVKQGRKLTQDGLGAGKSGPELQRAQALMQIAANQPDRALPTLKNLAGAAPKDGWLQLYTGWAELEAGDTDAALKAFEAAIATAPGAKVPALYGEGQAKLLKADIPGAHDAFVKVLAIDKDHLGAQVGLAATHPPQESAQKEADLLAVLQRDEVQKNLADPRVVVNAYDMAGDIARIGGRLDIARERYRKAISISKLDIPAHVGLATVELKDGKPQVAADLVAKASAADANNADLQLLSAELDVTQGKLPDASSKLAKLAERKPPLPPLLAARMHVIKGQLLEKQGKDDDAVAEYTEGSKLAGELDLAPTMAAVNKLTDLAKKATDPAKAADYNKRAEDMLSALSERAKEDGELSLALGVAYLQAGNAAKAEDSLRRANTLREKDPETKLQLARALNAQNKTDEAIAQLKEALEIDPKRIDVALELAHTYAAAGKDKEAMAAYDKLLADPATPIVARVGAGKYFASKGEREKAAAQAEKILAVEPENPGGLYLKGEGLILAGKWDEARQVLTKASDADQGEAMYLEALGRAFEGSLAATEDKKFIESARYAYERATKLDPKMLHAQIGLGHMLVEAGDYMPAITPLQAAAALDKSNSEVMYWMGRAYYGVRTQGPAQAKACTQWLEAALKAQPPLPPALRAEAGHRLGGAYYDLNNAAAAARGFEIGIAAAEEVQKQTGKSPEWLVEDYYKVGEMYDLLHNPVMQKKYWQKYVDSNPTNKQQKDTATQALLTELKRF